jgi:hypothetical protein
MRVEVVEFVRYQDGGRQVELLPGQTRDIPDALARPWIAAGRVRPVTEDKRKRGGTTASDAV